jgi:hypothetical protein
MTSELTTIQTGGQGVDFTNPLFRLKPVTIAINQPNTQVDGAIKGKLRITETGQQFDEMLVTLLKMPVIQRQYYTGGTGTMNRTPDNLVCFSRDNIRPDETAKVPQAMLCSNCKNASWDRYNETKVSEDKPACDAFYYAMFIDTVYNIPMRMFVRSLSKKSFEAGMSELSRTLYMMQSQGMKPNVYDVAFKLSTKKVLTRGLPSYVVNLSDFQVITPEQQAKFGAIYLQFLNRVEDTEADVIEADAAVIDAKLAGPIVGEYVGEDIKL